MKSLKSKIPSKLLLVSLAAVTLGGAALAQTPTPIVIYIAGANGDRATTNTAISNILAGENFSGVGGAGLTAANYAIFKDGTFNGTPVTVKVSYQGAAAGIAQVAGSLPGFFLADGSTTDPTGAGAPRDSSVPQIAMSTNFQATTPFFNNYQGHFYEDLSANDNIVDVVGLKWYASPSFPGDNITPQLAQYLFGSGAAPLSFFTGLATDRNKVVFATGRNLDAGQRFVAQAESGIGIYGTVKQYKATFSGQSTDAAGYKFGGTVTSQQLFEIQTTSGVSSQFLGNGGVDTGKNLAPYLTAPLTANAYTLNNTLQSVDENGVASPITAGYYVSYLTPQDGDVAVSHGATELKWNGVPYSVANVAEGRYTFWTYEHLFFRNSLAVSQDPSDVVIKAFADALILRIKNFDATVSGIKLSDVFVTRSGEGTLVKAKYF